MKVGFINQQKRHANVVLRNLSIMRFKIQDSMQ